MAVILLAVLDKMAVEAVALLIFLILLTPHNLVQLELHQVLLAHLLLMQAVVVVVLILPTLQVVRQEQIAVELVEVIHQQIQRLA
jgi:hypothetical protein